MLLDLAPQRSWLSESRGYRYVARANRLARAGTPARTQSRVIEFLEPLVVFRQDVSGRIPKNLAGE